jgi:hypothetical protein
MKILICFFLIFGFYNLNANQKNKQSIKIKDISVIEKNKKLELKFDFETDKKANYIRTLENFYFNNREIVIDTIINVNKEKIYNKKWNIKIPEDGNYSSKITLKSINNNDTIEGNAFISKYIDYEIKDGKLVNYTLQVDTNSYKNLIETQGSSIAFLNEGSINKINKTHQNTINVSISGKLIYEDSDILKIYGVPVKIKLDWDVDNNITTSYTPYSGNTRHVNWDVADIDGNFYFSFTFNSNLNANQIANKIRIFGATGNDACKPFFSSFTTIPMVANQDRIDISNNTLSITVSNQDFIAKELYAAPIHHLTNAWEFHKNVFNETLNPLKYEVIESFPPNEYVSYDESLSYVKIRDYVLNPVVAYHEYGHYVHHVKDNNISILNCSSASHNFQEETNYYCAFVEGWAIYYQSKCFEYWYNVANTNILEYTFQGGECLTNYNDYQLLDYGQNIIFCSNKVNEKVEGAVACFMYSLSDNYNNRSPLYSGDNDDLYFSPIYLLNNLQNARINAAYYNVPFVKGLLFAVENGLSLYQYTDTKNSLNALYDNLFYRIESQRPATPTILNISGDNINRFLSWNDNTCPYIGTFTDIGSYTKFYDFYENDEVGFQIYRKSMTQNESWDGTLTNFTLIGTTNQNLLYYTDNTNLSWGRYCYVVVAHDNYGHSIPSAYKIIECSATGTPNYIFINEEIKNVNRNFAAKIKIETSNTDDVNIIDNSVVKMCSGIEIVFKPGTVVESGSFLRAYIDDCPGCSYSESISPKISEDVFEDEIKIKLNTNFTLSPNPADESIRVSYQITGSGKLYLRSSLGVDLIPSISLDNAQGIENIDISKFPVGIYLISIESDSGIHTDKFVISR